MLIAWRGLHIEVLDVVALLWFFIWWMGYARFAEQRGHQVPSLLSTMGQYRRDWWVRILERELRIVDTAIMANLSNSATFFASTTLLILGGLLALLGTTEKVVAVMQGLPFSARTAEEVWEIKILLLVGIFVYAFFKFTWSLRQFNFASILVGAAPPPKTEGEQDAGYVDRGARLSHSASETFNNGLRAYYFGLAALAWFVNAWFFMAATTWVVFVLYWREFRSSTLALLKPRQ